MQERQQLRKELRRILEEMRQSEIDLHGLAASLERARDAAKNVEGSAEARLFEWLEEGLRAFSSDLRRKADQLSALQNEMAKRLALLELSARGQAGGEGG